MKPSPNILTADEPFELTRSRTAIKTSGYWTTNDLMRRFKVSKMTLWRWMTREENPLPPPKFKGKGSQNRWAIEAITAWEDNQGAV